MNKLTLLSAAFLLLTIISKAQEEKIDTAMIRRIREEGLGHSQVSMIAHYLTDVSGPRLTNSPGFKRAGNWAVATFKQWGLPTAMMEPWGEFGKGWELEKSYVA